MVIFVDWFIWWEILLIEVISFLFVDVMVLILEDVFFEVVVIVVFFLLVLFVLVVRVIDVLFRFDI